jgi:formiminotetrahydrofolate cyclodeaminase
VLHYTGGILKRAKVSVPAHHDASESSHSQDIDMPIPAFLKALGSSAPTPGGGAASAVVGATAAALAEMVAQLTAGKPAYAAVDEDMRAVMEEAERLRHELLELVEADERGFAEVTSALRLPKATPAEKAVRAAAVQKALVVAMQAPLRVMEVCGRVLALALDVARQGNRNLASDAGCAAIFGEAAVRAAGLNVLANVVLLDDEAKAGSARGQVTQHISLAEEARRQVMRLVDPRLERAGGSN